MLCSLCETFTADVLHEEYLNWKRLGNENWYAFKHGHHFTISASAAAGCSLCQLFCDVREARIPDYRQLGEKWLFQNAMIDVDISGPKSTFHLLTELPSRSWIAFELFQPLESEAGGSLQDPELPLEVAASVHAEGSVQSARSWLRACENDHTNCVRPQKTPLPTRVIDVGSSDPATARLLVSHGESAPYVTLSHTWGEGPSLTATKENLQGLQLVISTDELPKTFQDAITLTRVMGMRYLWIDALCIVQNDEQDWYRESATMCAVYENALFSISALSATGSQSGMLVDRSVDQRMISVVGIGTLGVRPKLDSLETALHKSKLESRAWCMQERILAPAILHVGPQQLFWECRSCVASETAPSNQHTGSSSIAASWIPSNSAQDVLYGLWYSLVTRYSTRDLTEPSDRLPAIAGLADKIKKELGASSRYSNGLWVDDLAAGLLWQRPLRREATPMPSRDTFSPKPKYDQANRLRYDFAPSWSWASVRGAVAYPWREEYSIPSPSRDDFTATVNGDSSKATIQIEGQVKRGTCRLSTSGTEKGNAGFKPSGSSVTVDSIPCILDSTEEIIPKQCYCLRISAWESPSISSGKRKSKPDRRAFYLILERFQGSVDDASASPTSSRLHHLGKFRRIGMGYDTPERVSKVFLNAERHALDLA